MVRICSCRLASPLNFQLPNGVPGDKMFQRIRRSFRKKKASHCFNCGHTSKACYHQEYENINLNQQSKSDHLKWLDLDSNNDLKFQQQFTQLRQRPHSAVYNEYTNMPFGDITVIFADFSHLGSRSARSSVLCKKLVKASQEFEIELKGHGYS